MINTGNNSSFPDQVVPDEVKNSWDFGLKVGRAIEGEWFGYARNNRYINNYNNFHQLRLYARGEQSVQKYKDELAIDGDLSYLNLDWKPVPVLSKFVDIVVNGMSQRVYDIKAYAQDPASQKLRTKYAEAIHKDIATRAYLDAVKASLGIDMSNAQNREPIPESEQELAIHMQLDYKQSIEIAEEEAITNTLDRNKYDLIKRRVDYDLAVLGIGANKTGFNRSNGVTVEYVDPAALVYSYTEDPNFEDIWYVGEVKGISIPELKKEFPYLTAADIEEIQKYTGNENYIRNWNGRKDNNIVQVLYFEYKTFTNQVFKIKQTATGLEKALEKDDSFNPPESENFDKSFRSIETLYSGAKVLSHPKMLRWELAKNMIRPKSNLVKVNMNYNICAPRMYRGRIDSLVSKTTGFADMIQLSSLKLQQVLSRMVPDGVFLDADGLNEVDLGNGTTYNPAEALNMYFQTGSIVGRSFTQDGDMNPGKVPIQELQSSGAQGKIQSLIQTYQYYLQMIRDVTGLNEARDASTPDKDSLVGLQKIAAANSNTATRHILQASLFLTARACENISLRISDAIEFDLTREALINSISSYNVGTLEELSEIHLYDFGIFLELEPDEEEKAQLEQNIQMALQQQTINLEDAIDIREVKNLKLANQLLKLKRKEKQQADQQAQQANIQAQAKANQETAEAAALAETQKQQVLTQQNIEYEKAKSQFEISRLREENELKKGLMAEEFKYDMQLAKVKIDRDKEKEGFIEDRKDDRTRLEGTQQSEMINQRENNLSPIDFNSPYTVDVGGFGV
tara:strand:+ start:188 stop:2572 length:2385 start_codon:yes stop_codon:yes gene_type:complete